MLQQQATLTAAYSGHLAECRLSDNTIERQLVFFVTTKRIRVGNLKGRHENRLPHRDTIRQLAISSVETSVLPITNITVLEPEHGSSDYIILNGLHRSEAWRSMNPDIEVL